MLQKSIQSDLLHQPDQLHQPNQLHQADPSLQPDGPNPSEQPDKREKFTFAMGCFWGPEDRFAQLPGVTATRVGYSGSELPLEAGESQSDHPASTAPMPTHRRLEGHSETVEVEFDPQIVCLEELLEQFWSMHNPQAIEGYKPDDSRYRSLLFYRDEQQREQMEHMQSRMNDQGRNSEATVLLPLGPFYPAEEKHQRYEEKKRERNRKNL